jgi:hypothetical protein
MQNQLPRNIYEVLGDIDTKNKMKQLLRVTQPTVTDDEKEVGVKTRYFARYKSNTRGSIYEISELDYSQIQNNSLFQKLEINWIIKGVLQDRLLTLQDGTSILLKGVISQNQALLAIANERMPGIIQHLQNHMEYWVGE